MHLLKVHDVKHLDVDGTILWERTELDNIFHQGGQKYLLSVGFNTGGSFSVPNNYYIGLDARSSPAAADTLSSLSQEPTQFGYARQPVSSANGFTMTQDTDNSWRALSNSVSFSAVGGSWGPVKNVFLATSNGSSGQLVSSVPLDVARTMTDGQTITLRISVGLVNC